MKTIERVPYSRRRRKKSKTRGAALNARNLKERVRDFERREILIALGETEGNKRQAALMLGVKPTTFYASCTRLGIEV